MILGKSFGLGLGLDHMLQAISEKALILALINRKAGLTCKRLKLIQDAYGDGLRAAAEDDLAMLRPTQGKWLQDAPRIMEEGDLERLEGELNSIGMGLISAVDLHYPDRLKQLRNYPPLLFYLGNSALLENREMLTVVGARTYTKYGETLLEQILRPLCRQGLGVVSGMALGIDGLAHQLALQENAPTIGVVGSGLDQDSFYPPGNRPLVSKVLEQGGLLLSEYQPGTKGNIYTFPNRNRILAALTDATWVVQAGRLSGSLITANLARELGKRVATSPGQIGEPTLLGNLDLLKEGAELVAEPDDLRRILGLREAPVDVSGLKPEFSSEIEELVYEELGFKPLSVDDLSQKTSKSVIELQPVLSVMELGGYVKSVGDNEWIRLG